MPSRAVRVHPEALQFVAAFHRVAGDADWRSSWTYGDVSFSGFGGASASRQQSEQPGIRTNTRSPDTALIFLCGGTTWSGPPGGHARRRAACFWARQQTAEGVKSE